LAAGLPTPFTLTDAMTKRRGPGFFERIADQMREFLGLDPPCPAVLIDLY
jgi:hypothetical protein